MAADEISHFRPVRPGRNSLSRHETHPMAIDIHLRTLRDLEALGGKESGPAPEPVPRSHS
jgi:hypothetical protein